MLKKLENYYRDKGILSTDFQCEHFAECRGDLPITPQDSANAIGTFTPARSAFVGEQYGKTNLPRLLFVSSDPGSTKTDESADNEVLITFAPSKNRTPESVQRLVMLRARLVREQKIKSNSKRLQATNELAFCILRAFNSEFAEESVMQHYAHANSVKCCENNSGRAEAKNRALPRNCRNYLRGEIDVFAPDIVVSLGKPAKEGAAFVFSAAVPEWGRLQTAAAKNGKEVLWLPLNHPRNGNFYAQKKEWGPDWQKFSEKIRAFMNERKSG